MPKKYVWQKQMEAMALGECYHDWVRPILRRAIREGRCPGAATTDEFDQLSPDEKIGAFRDMAAASAEGTTLTVQLDGKTVECHAGIDLGIDMEDFGVPYVITETYAWIRDAKEGNGERGVRDWPLVASPMIQWLVNQSNLGEGDWGEEVLPDDGDPTPPSPQAGPDDVRGNHKPADIDDFADSLIYAMGHLGKEQFGEKEASKLLLSEPPLHDRELLYEAREALLKDMDGIVCGIAEHVHDSDGWYGSPWEGDYDHCVPRLVPPEANGRVALDPHNPGADMLRRRSYIIDELDPAFAIACISCDLSACVKGHTPDSALRHLVTGEAVKHDLDFLFASTIDVVADADAVEGTKGKIRGRGISKLSECVKGAIYKASTELFRRVWERAITKLTKEGGLPEEGTWDEDKRSNIEAWRAQFEAGFYSVMLEAAGGNRGRSSHMHGNYCSPKSIRANLNLEALVEAEKMDTAAARRYVAAQYVTEQPSASAEERDHTVRLAAEAMTSEEEDEAIQRLLDSIADLGYDIRGDG